MENIVRTPAQLSQALKTERTRKRLTQAQAASNVGLLPKTISGLEQKPGGSSIESLFRLMSALGLEMVIREKSSSSPDSSGLRW